MVDVYFDGNFFNDPYFDVGALIQDAGALLARRLRRKRKPQQLTEVSEVLVNTRFHVHAQSDAYIVHDFKHLFQETVPVTSTFTRKITEEATVHVPLKQTIQLTNLDDLDDVLNVIRILKEKEKKEE